MKEKKQILSAKAFALRDMKENNAIKAKKSRINRYKREGYNPFKNGYFDTSDAPYEYNSLIGLTF